MRVPALAALVLLLTSLACVALIADPGTLRPPAATVAEAREALGWVEPVRADGVTSAASGATADTVYVPVGQSIQAAVNARPAGTAFRLGKGVHRLQQVRPKAGQSFLGESGTVLSGARQLLVWQREGAYWYAAGQTQEGSRTSPTTGTGESICEADHPRCNYPEALWVNDTLYRHVARLADVGPGAWFFDYARDRIYVGVNPTGRRVETAVVPYAFSGSAPDVTVRGLTVEKYATPTHRGAIDAGAARGWRILENTLQHNKAAGAKVGPVGVARGNRAVDNGQYGLVAATADSAVIEQNEIARNGAGGVRTGWAAGGTKFSRSRGMVIRGNHVHHNAGVGLWNDVYMMETTVDSNVVEDHPKQGIFHEISYRAVIRGNVVRRNGTANWYYGAGILVAHSADVTVTGNVVEDNAHAIMGIQQARGSHPEFGPHELRNLVVTHNTVKMPTGRTGVADDVGDPTIYTARGISFRANTYDLGENAQPFVWAGRPADECGWRAAGQDLTGLFSRLPLGGGAR